MRRAICALFAGLALAAGTAHGHGGHGGTHRDGATRDAGAVSFGEPGDSKKISRTVQVEMTDSRCVLPAELRLRRGDTVRFMIRNSGTRTHELVLGTSHELKQHSAQSDADPDAEHDEPYIVHVEPKKTGSLVWRFTRVGLFGYGCLLRGTGADRMTGRIAVTS